MEESDKKAKKEFEIAIAKSVIRLMKLQIQRMDD